MTDMIMPPIFGVLLSSGLLFLLSKKNNIKWILLAFGIYYIAMFAFFDDFMSLGFILDVVSYFIYLPLYFMPFVLYAVFNKFDSFLFTFIFPVSIVLTEFIGMLFVLSPGMNIEYRFFYVTPLVQCASIVGASGLSFILGWFLSSAVTMISKKFEKKYVIAAIASTLLLIAAVVFGEVRLLNADAPTQYVHAAWAMGPELEFIDGEWEGLPFGNNLDVLCDTLKEAHEKGAELVVYPEEAFGIETNGLDAFLLKAKIEAKKYKMAILLGVETEDTDGGNCQNVIYYIGKDGEILDEYHKHMVIPILEAGFKRGEGRIDGVKEEFEECSPLIAYTICYDGNFEKYIRTMPDDAGIYLYPSWDWADVENNHTMIAGFRAIENGVTLVKPTMFGRSVMYDEYGRILFDSNTKNGFEKVYMIDIPVCEKVTFYERFGLAEDIVLLVCAAALFTYASIFVIKKKKENKIEE